MPPCPECGEELKEDKVSLDDRKTLFPDVVEGNIRYCGRIWNMPIIIQNGPISSPCHWDRLVETEEELRAAVSSIDLDRFEKDKECILGASKWAYTQLIKESNA